MDISVSRLNKRMALELPPEFPLGLVFVVGEVNDLDNTKDGANSVEFYLSEGDHLLNCRLSDRVAGEVTIKEGDLIRAGGHLAFEPTRAGYYLLARDVEILSEYRPSQSTLKMIIADKDERVQTTKLVPAEIPPWVEQLAPPEIRAELAVRNSSLTGFEAAAGDVWKHYSGTDVSVISLEKELLPSGFTDELIEFLSEAMDGQEDIELTPELLAEYGPSKEPASPTEQDLEALKELEAALMLTILKEDSLPPAKIGKNDPAKSKLVPTVDENSDIQVNTPPEGRQERFESGPTPVRTRNQREQIARQEQATTIPWYVVALVIFLTVLFGAVFLIVALNSTLLPLPFTFPG